MFYSMIAMFHSFMIFATNHSYIFVFGFSLCSNWPMSGITEWSEPWWCVTSSHTTESNHPARAPGQSTALKSQMVLAVPFVVVVLLTLFGSHFGHLWRCWDVDISGWASWTRTMHRPFFFFCSGGNCKSMWMDCEYILVSQMSQKTFWTGCSPTGLKANLNF